MAQQSLKKITLLKLSVKAKVYFYISTFCVPAKDECAIMPLLNAGVTHR
jgi:hypothetical protein